MQGNTNPILKAEEGPWISEHIELGLPHDNGRDGGSLLSQVGPTVILFPCHHSDRRLNPWRCRDHLRARSRGPSRLQHLHPQGTWYLHSRASFPSGNYLIMWCVCLPFLTSCKSFCSCFSPDSAVDSTSGNTGTGSTTTQESIWEKKGLELDGELVMQWFLLYWLLLQWF